jgi:predicted Fe-Mo cluster-binding NifX family protein
VKIAVASEDGVNISHHFGRSRCFLVFEIQDQQVIGRSLRDNSFDYSGGGTPLTRLERGSTFGLSTVGRCAGANR